MQAECYALARETPITRRRQLPGLGRKTWLRFSRPRAAAISWARAEGWQGVSIDGADITRRALGAPEHWARVVVQRQHNSRPMPEPALPLPTTRRGGRASRRQSQLGQHGVSVRLDGRGASRAIHSTGTVESLTLGHVTRAADREAQPRRRALRDYSTHRANRATNLREEQDPREWSNPARAVHCRHLNALHYR